MMKAPIECHVAHASSIVSLTHLSLDITIIGPLVQVRTTARFFNPTNEDLEGEIVFHMDEGSTVCGYACDIRGRYI